MHGDIYNMCMHIVVHVCRCVCEIECDLVWLVNHFHTVYNIIVFSTQPVLLHSSGFQGSYSYGLVDCRNTAQAGCWFDLPHCFRSGRSEEFLMSLRDLSLSGYQNKYDYFNNGVKDQSIYIPGNVGCLLSTSYFLSFSIWEGGTAKILSYFTFWNFCCSGVSDSTSSIWEDRDGDFSFELSYTGFLKYFLVSKPAEKLYYVNYVYNVKVNVKGRLVLMLIATDWLISVM